MSRSILVITGWWCLLLVMGIEGLGVNWGTMANHKLPPKTVVQLLKDNGINMVKLFDADQSTMSALASSGIEVMIAIPNNQLSAMNSYAHAKGFVRHNVSRYNFDSGVTIKKELAFYPIFSLNLALILPLLPQIIQVRCSWK